MANPAVEFVAQGNKLCLIYRPRDDASWVHGRFANGEPLDIKGIRILARGLRLQRLVAFVAVGASMAYGRLMWNGLMETLYDTSTDCPSIATAADPTPVTGSVPT